MSSSKNIFFALILAIFLEKQVNGHGMMLEPPNRSSLWRFYKNLPINYDDNMNFCGGFSVQWGTHGGKCGVCGDRYDSPHPQDNENTGKYGTGFVPRKYRSGSVIDVHIKLTVNHMGYFQYSLCHLKDPKGIEPGERCFKKLQLENGSSIHQININDRMIHNRVRLPQNLKCERCVLRWTYTAANNWGTCPDGTGRVGCGPQETFRSCSDIAIY